MSILCTVPYTFCPGAVQIIGNLLNGRMAGEGNLMRHLAQLSYKLHYIQDPLADFDFTLTSLAAELRDGLRLCKLAEVLTGDNGCPSQTHLTLCATHSVHDARANMHVVVQRASYTLIACQLHSDSMPACR